MYNNSVIKTPLSRSYSFYYRILNHQEEYSNSLSTQQYQEHVKKIGSFETVEDFWAIFQHLKKPDNCKPGVGFYLFKQEIKPLWEDDCNKKGGRISFRLNKKFTTILWEEIVMAFIGDVFPSEFSNEITGIIVSVKDTFNVIQFWVKDFSKRDVIDVVKETIVNLFDIPESINIKSEPFHKRKSQQPKSKRKNYFNYKQYNY